MRLIIFIQFLLLSLLVNGQSYVELSNSTGYDLSIQDIGLDSASSVLVSSFPEAFQDNFRVYDLGFYTILGADAQIFQKNWENAITEASSQSDYFLLFGRHLLRDGTLDKISIKLKLPRDGSFSCFDESYFFNLEFRVSQEVERVLSDYQENATHYDKAALAGIDKLRTAIEDIVECCYENKSLKSLDCSLCTWSASDARGFLAYSDFDSEPAELLPNSLNIDSSCFCQNDTEYYSVELEGEGIEVLRASEIEDFIFSGDTVSVEGLINELVEMGSTYSMNNYTFLAVITDNSIFCNSQVNEPSKADNEVVDFDFVNDKINSVDIGIWIHIQYDNFESSVNVRINGVGANILKDCTQHPLLCSNFENVFTELEIIQGGFYVEFTTDFCVEAELDLLYVIEDFYGESSQNGSTSPLKKIMKDRVITIKISHEFFLEENFCTSDKMGYLHSAKTVLHENVHALLSRLAWYSPGATSDERKRNMHSHSYSVLYTRFRGLNYNESRSGIYASHYILLKDFTRRICNDLVSYNAGYGERKNYFHMLYDFSLRPNFRIQDFRDIFEQSTGTVEEIEAIMLTDAELLNENSDLPCSN